MKLSLNPLGLVGKRRVHTLGAATTDVNWQRLWVSISEKRWSSLAVLATDAGIAADRVAKNFVTAGRQHGSRSIRLLHAEGINFSDTQTLIEQIVAMTDRGELVVIVLDPVANNPAVIPIVRVTSGVLLVARLGASRLSSARSSVNALGHDRVFGSVVVR